MRMRIAIVLLLLAPSVLAQDLFPRVSITGGISDSRFDTNARIDPEVTGGEGTLVGFERDLGLEDSQSVERYRLQWRPFRKHELAADYFTTRRRGSRQIVRDIVFRDQVYPVNAIVTTRLDLDYASATYTYWARRTDRDGLGITLGLANMAIDAIILAQQQVTVTISETANTDVPVALAGAQSRIAFTDRIHAEAGVSTLPRVTIEDYTGTALTAYARVEYRPVRWLGIGAAYSYFRLDVDVAQTDLSGAFDMTIQGPEGYVRLAW